MPPLHEPEQHCCPLMHMVPLGWQLLQPHMSTASWTQIASQATWQQNGSMGQTCAAHALQAGWSLSPWTHCPWLHTAAPQNPPSHVPLQQDAPSWQGAPSGVQGLPHWFRLHEPEQHSSGKLQKAPLGLHMPPQTPCAQVSEQQSSGSEQSEPFGRHPPQMPPLQEPEQHCPANWHSKPFGKQASTHCPPWQLPLQHWLALAH